MRAIRTLAVSMAAALLLSPAVVAHADPAPTGPEPGTPSVPAAALENSPIRVVSYNTKAGLSVATATADLTALAAKSPQVMALQEMSSPAKRQWVRENLACETCRYAGYIPTSAVPGGTPILFWRNRFRLLHAETVQVTEDTYVGPRGAGPSTLRAKYINWVQLRDLASGRRINILNNHAAPSVQAADGGPNLRNPERVKLYKKHMRGLVALIQRIRTSYGGEIVVTGDFNVNYRRDVVLKPTPFPYVNMREVGVQASYEQLGEPAGGTHGTGTRLIDYVSSEPRPTLRAVSQRILTGFHSDHKPILVALQLKGLAAPATPPATGVDGANGSVPATGATPTPTG